MISRDFSHYFSIAERSFLCSDRRMTAIPLPPSTMHCDACPSSVTDASDERRSIACAQRGCARARSALLAAAVEPVRALMLARYGREQDRDDLMQEALLELHTAIDRYDLAHPARVRLLSFARKAMLGAAERYRRRHAAGGDGWPDGLELADESCECPVEACDDDRLLPLLSPALARLPPRSQEVLRSRRLVEPPVRLRTLAARLNISHPRVLMLERQALQQVHAALLDALGTRAAA
jgi:RNA polymerase sigma factor (sigma-70 family)